MGRKPKSVDPEFGPLLSDKEVAERLGWSVNTLWWRRSEGKPTPRCVKFSARRVKTPEVNVTEFIREHLEEET